MTVNFLSMLEQIALQASDSVIVLAIVALGVVVPVSSIAILKALRNN